MGLTVPEPPPWMWQTTTTTTDIVITSNATPHPWCCDYCGTLHANEDLACRNCGAQRQERGRGARILGRGRP